MPWDTPQPILWKVKETTKNVPETSKLKSWELGGYCCVEAVWEGFWLSAAKTGKRSSESTCDDRKGGTMHRGHSVTPSSGAFVLSLWVRPTWKLWELGDLPDEENGYSLLLQSLPFWPNLHIKLVLHLRVRNEFLSKNPKPESWNTSTSNWQTGSEI